MKGKICRNEGKEEKNPMSTSSSSIFETFENLVSIFSSFFSVRVNDVIFFQGVENDLEELKISVCFHRPRKKIDKKARTNRWAESSRTKRVSSSI